MLKNVNFVNQSSAESNVGLPNWAVISITDCDDARIKQGWHSVLRSQFSDVDMQHSERKREKAISEDQALEIVDFVNLRGPG